MSELRSRSSGSMTNSSADTTPSRATEFPVLDLDDARAQAPEVAGAKASALSRARVAKLPALPGFVVTTEGVRAPRGPRQVGRSDVRRSRQVARALRERGTVARRSVVVAQRGRRVAVDGRHVHVGARRAGLAGIPRRGRRGRAFRPRRADRGTRPTVPAAGVGRCALRCRPRDRTLRPSRGCRSARRPRPIGVRRSRWRTARALAAWSLARGERGHTRRAAKPEGAPTAGSSRRPRATFGGPQDIEWAIEANGSVVLLQSRPITALGDEARAAGPVFGPGPVAETFGLPLRPLEEDLWVAPLRDALREALTLAGATPARQLRGSPIVVTVGGRVAVDLDLLGLTRRRRSVLRKLDPRPPARRLKAAWRVGRLKVALPALAEDLIAGVDADLRSVPDMTILATADLIRLLRRSHQTLVALHGHEVLAGLLLDEGDEMPTAASAALTHLGRARARARRCAARRGAPGVARPGAAAHQHRARSCLRRRPCFLRLRARTRRSQLANRCDCESGG